MVRKKLLTLLSVVGLLACGACFLPPPHSQPPTPPPYLRGVDGIFLEVTDSSDPHKIDTDQLGRWTAASINARNQGRNPRVYSGGQPKAGDAELHVSIGDEGAASKPEPQSPQTRWTFTVSIAATLTAADGAVLWQKSSRQFHLNRRLLASTPELAWQSPAVAVWLRSIAYDLAVDMLRINE
jgi:hypothetical protein